MNIQYVLKQRATATLVTALSVFAILSGGCAASPDDTSRETSGALSPAIPKPECGPIACEPGTTLEIIDGDPCNQRCVPLKPECGPIACEPGTTLEIIDGDPCNQRCVKAQ